MSVSAIGDHMIDYAPCRYNGSRLWFRGPARALDRPYLACLGGCAVYGRYLAQPFPALLGARLAMPVLNLGVENAGPDAYLNDPGALATAANAKTALIQLAGSHNISNRFYRVHPRRNDRFLSASPTLRALYPEMDFTEVHFTRHLLSALFRLCPNRFEAIATEVRLAWRARMRHLIHRIRGDVVLFWLAPFPLSEARLDLTWWDIFLDARTVDGLRPHVHRIIEVVSPDWDKGKSRMQVPLLEQARARLLPGPAVHRQAAEVLACAIHPRPM